MSLSSYDSSARETINLLFAQDDWVDLYALHEDYLLSPAQVLDVVERLVAADFAERVGLMAKLSESGRDWVISSRREIFSANKASWRSFDNAAGAYEPNQPYLPDLEKVDRDHFERLGSI